MSSLDSIPGSNHLEKAMLMPHPVRFGLLDMDPFTGAQPVSLGSPTGLQGWRDDAEQAERLEFDVLWCADHLFYFVEPHAPFLNGWALLPAWAAVTTTIRLGVLITNLSWRSPVQVARSAIAVDQLSGGRLELGVGTGAFGDQAMAGMFEMAPSERIGRLREGVGVLDRLLRNDVTPFNGEFTTYTEAHTEPGCVQSPRVPLTIGAVQRRAIEVAVDLADTWSTYSDPLLPLDEAHKDIVSRVHIFEELCATKGRDPDELRRSLLVLNPLDAWESTATVEHIVELYVGLGFSEFVFHRPMQNRVPTFERVAQDVLPRLRVQI
jgi:alkanesulfonate monooxygenase SsuD/methylene tetrahydromethanopterin reductase-like flavin-dependent oxidoreductase (luciferase family)